MSTGQCECYNNNNKKRFSKNSFGIDIAHVAISSTVL